MDMDTSIVDINIDIHLDIIAMDISILISISPYSSYRIPEEEISLTEFRNRRNVLFT